MDLFDRNNSLLDPVMSYACVPNKPGVSREQQFEQWLDTLPPRCCSRHNRTPLTLDRESSRLGSLSVATSSVWYRWHMNPRQIVQIPDRNVIADFYPFEACYRCPACKVEYAQAPPLFFESSFDAFQTSTTELKRNLARCREFVRQVNARNFRFLVMCGMFGTGKTMLACNIIRELNHSDSLYKRQAQLTNALRATYGRKDVFLHSRAGADVGDTTPPLLEGVQQVGFLVLEEIGCAPLAADERMLLDELLKHRYDYFKPTILISNLPIKGNPDKPGLKEYLGDALTDRINEATANGKFILQFSGNSFRRTRGESCLDGLG